MIYTQELLILFTTVVIVAALAAGALSGFVQSNVSKAKSVGEEIQEQVASDVDIVGIHATGTEMNIYVKGLAGAVDLEPTVFVDGTVANVTTYGFIRDGGDVNKVNAGDLAYITVSGSFADGKTHKIRVVFPQAEAEIEKVIG